MICETTDHLRYEITQMALVGCTQESLSIELKSLSLLERQEQIFGHGLEWLHPSSPLPPDMLLGSTSSINSIPLLAPPSDGQVQVHFL